MLYLYQYLLVGFFIVLAASKSTFTPTRPPSLPLAVKSPYLSAWLPAGSQGRNGGYLPGQWPKFWMGPPLGWAGLIRVDGKTFTWLGAPKDIGNATQVAYEYTSTRSIFTIEVDGKVTLTATFLSPVTPEDYERQSLTFSYLQVEVSSMDGCDHEVSLYSDISAEWVSGDPTSTAQWDYGTTGNISYHKVWKQNQQHFSEINDMAEWGNTYYATDTAAGLTYQSGVDEDVRGEFVKKGKLTNAKDTGYRPINSRWPVFGFAVDLGTVNEQSTSTLFTIGLCQDEAVQFLGADGLTILPSLWKTYYGDDITALSFFHNDYTESSKLCSELDDQIASDSVAAAGENYKILTTLAVRQVFGATQFVGKGSKYYLFLKEISSNGNTQTVDVIFPASPIFYYLNPDLVRLLLEPHFENQESSHYPNSSAIHDLGIHYPNATGHPDGQDESMPLEECGNQLTMVLAYVQRSGNTEYLKQHYPILQQWTEYLVSDSLYPAQQLSTDDFAGHLANQTNLALKGIIGIKAMSEIATLIGDIAAAQNYTNIAHDFLSKWLAMTMNLAVDPPHAILNYNNASTFNLLYNLYNDRLLSTRLVPDTVYDMQSAFYPTVIDPYGIPLDSRNRFWTKSDWQMFCAAVAEEETRDLIIERLARWVGETRTSLPCSDLYMTDLGGFPPSKEGTIVFRARPVVGGMFALLALKG